jgi:hypothetical protein
VRDHFSFQLAAAISIGIAAVFGFAGEFLAANLFAERWFFALNFPLSHVPLSQISPANF